MPGQLNRYSQPNIVEHLASNYVIGTLPPRVRARMETLIQLETDSVLSQRVRYWESTMASLDENVEEIAPKQETWQHIVDQVNKEQSKTKRKQWLKWPRLELAFHRFATIAIVMVLAVILYPGSQSDKGTGELSYIAVLSDGNTHNLVASAYGKHRELVLDVINLPELSPSHAYELWAISKSDKQPRSLGIVPVTPVSQKRHLSEKQWRLIQSSESLHLTMELAGGALRGIPSHSLIAKGACITVDEWE
ncbi:anti-sigma factor [Algicola sagamiensis]|uniref:anti-sigma factor n=1 Tax=Algicola sagamiensis TaxID=163869 RepID=UPI00036702BC|nr:anti-sigma factor [Algicola sagamiensis]